MGWDNMQTKLECCGVISIDDWSSLDLGDNCSAPWSCRIQPPSVGADQDSLVTPALKLSLSSTTSGQTREVTNVTSSNETLSNGTSSNGKSSNGTSSNGTSSNGQTTESITERQCLEDRNSPHNNEGCLPKLKDVLQSYISIIGGILISVWCIVIINVLFSFALCVVLDYADTLIRPI